MKDDTKKILARMEKELLDAQPEEEMFPQPFFEDMDTAVSGEDPEVYRNFSNGYGRDLEEESTPKKQKPRGNLGLMIAVIGLCLGIMGVLLYWLIRLI